MLTKRFFILFLLLFIGGFSFVSAADFHPTINPENMGRFGMGNPAVAYCKELGYKFANIENEGGETSVCIFSEDITVKNITNGDVKNENSSQVLFCDGWEFFQGKCGAEYSYCSKNGYGIKTLEDGANSLSDKYAVCILNSSSSNQEGLMRAQTNAGKSEISVDELMNLDDKISIKASVDSFNSSENEVGFDGRKSDDLQRSNMITNANGLAATPSSFDWRTKDGKNWMSSVKSQGSCGSCWAFGAVAGVESKIKIAKNDPNFEVDLAEQHLVSSCSNAGDCDGGWHYLALDFVKNSGIVDELCYPYTATDSQCSAICSSFEQRLWKIDGYNKITGGRETIKEFLVEKGPLPTAILMSGSFDSNGIYRCNNPQWINHVVVLTGYDDIGGYWIAKNSWGTNWGNSGYFKIGYGECNVEMMPYYIELEESSGSNKIIGNNIRVSPGSVSGSLSSTSEKDGAYMTLTESCSGFGCSGLNANITFSTTSLSNVQSMDVVAYHRGRNEDGFSVRYSDLNQNKVINLGSVPDSKWGLAKFRICNSIEECSAYLLKNLTINYFHPSCSFCNTDNVDIDLLSLEFVNDQYCQAETTSSSFEYISRVELNGAESNSGSSTYSDFTDSSLASLNRGGTYTIFVNGATSGNYSEHVKAWIDFNNNKELNSGEEIDLGSFIFFGEHTFSGTFAVPTDSILADVRMRVYLKFGSSPTQCEKADFGEVEDYVISIISDTTPPSMWISDYGVGYIEAGQNVNVRVNVRDQSDISFVNSTIKNSNENIVGSLELYDDGLHGDDLAGDGIYGNYWSTPINEEDYTIDISSEDSFENSITFEKLDKFTTKPFTVDSDILLVDSAFYYSDRSYISYFEEALNSNNVDYKLWDYGLRGRINNNILNSFGAIIWSSPSWKMPTIEEQEGLIDFLNNKGRLFITGQDFGFYLNGTDFYDNYLHARYVQDDANLLGLSGTNGDPISDGLAINIFGDGGANNQFWPSEIDPISPATSVFVYNNLFPGDSNLPQEIPIAMLPQKEKPKGVNTASSTASSGSGAIKVDTGVYKVVYFAFGFEAINDANDRSIIMDRVLDWFSDFNVYSPNQSIYTDSRVPFNISSEKVVDKITWIDNSDERSRERTLCSRFCTSYGNDRKKLQSFNDGFHSVTFKTLKNNTVDKEKTINFVVDTKDPKISKTNPKSGFSNGNFSVEFVEQNPQSLILHYGNNQTGFETKDFPDDCNFKRDKWSCFTIANLSTYDNQSIEYWFELHDIINNTVISKKNFVKADTTLPVINLFKYDIGLFRRVTFTLNITELNFDKVNYIDWNDLRPSPRVLCSGLKNNVCTITKSFRSGTHNLTIGVFDKSGNSANKNLSFVI